MALPLYSLPHHHEGRTTVERASGELLGVLYLDSHRPAVFSRMKQRVLEALAHEAATVLANAHFLEKEEKRRRLEQELTIGRQIQQALLPTKLPKYPHMELTGINRPCHEVGGDYFDVMEVGHERIAFVIADVSGKGLGAALLAAMVQGTFAAVTPEHDPAAVFSRLNQFIWTHEDIQRHATIFFGILDADGQLAFINAGHQPPLRVRAGRVEPMFPAQSVPVGLVADENFKVCHHVLKPGDTVVLFTDGITEAENSEHEQFGGDRLLEVVMDNAEASLQELQHAILSAVEEFTHGAPQLDDITLLILRYLAVNRPPPLEHDRS